MRDYPSVRGTAMLANLLTRPRDAAILAWSLFGLSLACSVVSTAALLWLRDMPGAASRVSLDSLSLLVYPLVGARIAARHPSNPIGWIFGAMGVVSQLYPAAQRAWIAGFAGSTVIADPPPAISLAVDVWVTLVGFFPLLFLLFPTGRPASRRWLPVVWLTVAYTIGLYLIAGAGTTIGSAVISYPSPVKIVFGSALGDALKPTGGPLLLPVLAFWMVSLASLVLRLRRARGDEFQQLKWFAYGCVLFVLLFSAFTMAWEFTPWLRPLDVTAYNAADFLLGLPMAVAFPIPAIAVGIAILRYRLYDIDRLISRTITYGVLWLCIALAYVGLSVVLGLAASERLPLAVAIVCTIVATVLFQPARRRLEQLADRWVFGERVSGYELVTRLGATLEHALGTQEVAPRVAATVRRGLQARWVRVSVMREGSVPEPIAADGIGLHEAADPALSVPLIYTDTHIGTIECGPKEGASFQPRDHQLLETLGRQAALAIRNAALASELAERLTEIERQARELAASRTRIVQAEEAGRRRIERDIHDGVQQELVALLAKARLARNQLAREPSLAEATLAELQLDTRQALEDLRELAHGIHPPVLTDRGLLEAIEAQTSRLPVPVHVNADGLGRDSRYPAEIEGAAYFLVCEGLANVLKHAAAARIEVRLAAQPGGLRVEIADDGRGFEPNEMTGSGLRGVADRVEALGGQLEIVSRPSGGTRLIAVLPARQTVPA